jgi:predicted transposase YdaD
MEEHTSTSTSTTPATPTPTLTAVDPNKIAQARRAELTKLLPAGARWGTDVGAASLVRQRVESLPPTQVTHARLVFEAVQLSKALAFCWEAVDHDQSWAARLQDAQRIRDVVQLVELLIAADAEQAKRAEQAEQAERQQPLVQNNATTSNS